MYMKVNDDEVPGGVDDVGKDDVDLVIEHLQVRNHFLFNLNAINYKHDYT